MEFSDFGSTTSGLFGLDSDGDLYSINSTTGAVHDIGSIGIGLSSLAIGLSTGSSTLYFTNGTDLYTINTSTGAAAPIGGTGGAEIGALVFAGGALYGGEYSPNFEIDTVNTSTGAAGAVAAVSGTSSDAIYGLAPAPGVPPVPEPSTWALAVAGLAAIGLRLSKNC